MTTEREEFDQMFDSDFYVDLDGIDYGLDEKDKERLWSWHQQSLERAVEKEMERIKDFAVDMRKLIGEEITIEDNEDLRTRLNGLMINGQKEIYVGMLWKLVEEYGLDPKEIYNTYQSSLTLPQLKVDEKK